MPHSDQEVLEDITHLAGALFEGGVLFYQSHLLSPQETLLTGEGVLEVYRALHPRAKLVKRPYGQSSLTGVSVSDGLKFVGGEVETVIEATFTGIPSHFETKHTGFQIEKRLSPEVFGNSRLLFIVTSNPPIPDYIVRDEDVDVLELRALTRSEFWDYVQELYKRYLLYEDSASLLKIQ